MTNSILIEKSESLIFKETGKYDLTIGDGDFTLDFNISSNIDVTLLIKTTGGLTNLKFETTLSPNSKLVALFWNENEGVINLVEEVTLLNDSFYQVVYGDLTSGDVNYKSNYLLKGQGAAVKANCALLANSKKYFDLTAKHVERNTSSDLENYGIVLEGADYDMTVTGHILKGAKLSSSHQTSRVLTINKVEKCQVLPQLLIDENEVEASHAASIGQIDSDQLYYLQSRGLTIDESLRLIALGYLLPVAEVIEDENLQNYLRDTITEKVANLCLT